MSEGFPHLPKSEIESVADSTNKVIQRIKTHSQKYVPMLTKNCGKFDKLYNDLIAEPINSSTAKSSTKIEEGEEQEKIEENVSEPELSVHGQYLLLESLSNLKKVIGEMSQDHKHPIHHLVSRCGKAIDQRFHSDISKLLKNEKEIESDPENLAHANRLIFEHLMGLGRTEMAETFQKESEMSLKLPNISNFDTLKEIMNAFKCNDYLPAINWVMENVPNRSDLLFRLKCQHIIQLLETKDKLAALLSVRELQSFPLEMDQYKEELTHLMFVVISYPQMGPYEYLFHKGRWFALEQELAHALTEYRGSLGTILSAGIKTIPSLMTMRAFLSSARPGNCPILPDELPCNVPVPEQVHSSFCCPILKVQSTESNPPVRLCCGHVISTDAMNKLAQQSRNNRLKCPYCPLESVLQETKVLHF